jgi:malate synthase
MYKAQVDVEELQRLRDALAELEARLYDDLATIRVARTEVARMLHHQVVEETP